MSTTFALNFFISNFTAEEKDTRNVLSSPGLLNFGKFTDMPYNSYELPLFMLIGIFGGLMGAFFNGLNLKITQFRMKYVKTRSMRLAEALLVCLFTTCVGFTMIFYSGDCLPVGDTPLGHGVQLFCDDHTYSAMGSLWFNTPETAIRNLFHQDKAQYESSTLALFTMAYLLVACITYGIGVPSGLFVPCILTGATLGRLCGTILALHYPNNVWADPGKYALIGAAAFLGGVVRMTISLAVIIIECTGKSTRALLFSVHAAVGIFFWVGSVLLACSLARANRRAFLYCLFIFLFFHFHLCPPSFFVSFSCLFFSYLFWLVDSLPSCLLFFFHQKGNITYSLPVILTLIFAKWSGDIFNEGLYDIHIELKHIPLLGWNAPSVARYKIQARDIMTKELKTLPLFNKVGDLYDILTDVKHGAFPVVKAADGGGNLALGWILTTELVMLLHKKAYGRRAGDTVLPRGIEGGELKWEEFRTAYPRWLNISDVLEPTDVEREMWIDLRPYMNAHPHSLREGSSLARTFDLFRTMGLRHLLITDDYNRLKGIVSRKDLYGVEPHHTYEDFN